jgi:hypothetical protein
LKLLPQQLQEWIELTANSKSCPVGYIAHALLISTAGLIGSSRAGSPWQNWVEPTILWGALVGEPSSGKSPALDPFMTAIRKLEADEVEGFKEQLRDYETKKESAKNHEKNWQEALSEAVKNKTTPPQKPVEAIAPDEPTLPRYIITDATSEKAAVILSKNHKGLLLNRDELSSMLTNFERRGGSDRGFYLESFGGRPYIVDRVKYNTPIVIPSLALSIIGCIQPDRLQSLLLEGDDDGLSARFLYCWPEPVAFNRPNLFPDDQLLTNSFTKLKSLKPLYNKNGSPESVILRFSEESAETINNWRKEQPEKEAQAAGILKSHIGKLSGLAVRLATVLTYLKWTISDELEEPYRIRKEEITAAIALLEDYYLPMATNCFGAATLPQDQKDAEILLKWLRAKKPDVFNSYELSRKSGSPIIPNSLNDMTL